jgi:hypothetical protein
MVAKRRDADLQEIQKAIEILFEPGRVVEVRAPHKDGCGAAYFDDYEDLANTIKRLSDDDRYHAVYMSINIINDEVITRAAPNIFSDNVTNTAKKTDIVRRCRLLIDIDPKRPAGVSATKEEKAKGFEVMLRVREKLNALGWAEPVVADSGNGYHLLYIVDEPNDPTVDKLFKNVLKALADKFSTDAVGIDAAVHDAARVTKAYGTLARKGPDTPERPHRYSKIKYVPQHWGMVSRAQLEALAATGTRANTLTKKHNRGCGIAVDEMQNFLDSAGVQIKSTADIEGGAKKWVLVECCFNPDHKDAAIYLSPTGIPHYGCFHQSCGGNENKWHDFRKAIETKTGKPFHFAYADNMGYESTPSGFTRHTYKKDGTPMVTKLTNFTAEIMADVKLDDGLERQREFVIKADCKGETSQFTVSASDFPSMNWVLKEIGGKAIISAGLGVRDHARAAIQATSGNYPSHTLYTHTGWVTIDGNHYYLHSAGAIGAEGLSSDIKVKFKSDLDKFKLPAPPTRERRKNAVQASLHFLDIAPYRITVPAYAATFRAISGGAGLSLHAAGRTGTYKSSVAGLCMAHYGAGWDWEHLPGSWSSTDNFNEEMQFIFKDALLVLDDFVPKGSASDIQRAHRGADRTYRAAANNAARGRLDRNAQPRPPRPPRCLLYGTGEDLPNGESLQARIWITDYDTGDVDFQKLKTCSKDAGAGLYAEAMAAYIQWYAANWDSIKRFLRERARRYHDAAAAASRGQHAKTPKMVAELMSAIDCFLLFATKCGAITSLERDQISKKAWHSLLKGAQSQTRGLADEEPARRFLDLLASALVNNRDAHLGDAGTGTSPNEAKGRCIGWKADGGLIFLDPETSYAVANDLARAQGQVLPLTKTSLGKRLRDQKLLVSFDEGRNTSVRAIGGRRQRVLIVAAKDILANVEVLNDD